MRFLGCFLIVKANHLKRLVRLAQKYFLTIDYKTMSHATKNLFYDLPKDLREHIIGLALNDTAKELIDVKNHLSVATKRRASLKKNYHDSWRGVLGLSRRDYEIMQLNEGVSDSEVFRMTRRKQDLERSLKILINFDDYYESDD